jgi:hypothetical protein
VSPTFSSLSRSSQNPVTRPQPRHRRRNDIWLPSPSFSCSMGSAVSWMYPSDAPTTSPCWRPISSERNPFITSARCPERPLALVVGRLDVAAEHQRFAARGHGNARPLVAASTSIGSRSSRRSRSRRCRCVAVVLSARSGRRCPTARVSFKNALN